MPVMATAVGTQDESAPEDDGDDENDASQGKDHGRKPKWPATSVPPVPPVWRFGGRTRLLSCSCRLSLLGIAYQNRLSARLIEAMFGNFFQEVFYVTGVNNDIFRNQLVRMR
jgi:hypothetical protein